MTMTKISSSLSQKTTEVLANIPTSQKAKKIDLNKSSHCFDSPRLKRMVGIAVLVMSVAAIALAGLAIAMMVAAGPFTLSTGIYPILEVLLGAFGIFGGIRLIQYSCVQAAPNPQKPPKPQGQPAIMQTDAINKKTASPVKQPQPVTNQKEPPVVALVNSGSSEDKVTDVVQGKKKGLNAAPSVEPVQGGVEPPRADVKPLKPDLKAADGEKSSAKGTGSAEEATKSAKANEGSASAAAIPVKPAPIVATPFRVANAQSRIPFTPVVKSSFVPLTREPTNESPLSSPKGADVVPHESPWNRGRSNSVPNVTLHPMAPPPPKQPRAHRRPLKSDSGAQKSQAADHPRTPSAGSDGKPLTIKLRDMVSPQRKANGAFTYEQTVFDKYESLLKRRGSEGSVSPISTTVSNFNLGTPPRLAVSPIQKSLAAKKASEQAKQALTPKSGKTSS